MQACPLGIESLNGDLNEDSSGNPNVKAQDRRLLYEPEIMHHSGGAWSETRYVYGEVIEAALQTIPLSEKMRVLSIGLGLGYNELLVSSLALKYQRIIELDSFEKDPFLQNSFLRFIQGPQWGKSLEQGLKKNPPEVEEIYELILKYVSGGDRAPVFFLRKLKEEANFRCLGSLSSRWVEDSFVSDDANRYNLILYDAFSSKTSPELWSENFLTGFIRAVSRKNCLFSTYACTGGLKRSMRQNGFEVFQRKGFQGKRNSLMASRGLSLSLDLIRGIS